MFEWYVTLKKGVGWFVTGDTKKKIISYKKRDEVGGVPKKSVT